MALIFKGGAQTVTGVAGGGSHSLFIKGDGSLWGMGFNTSGELGNAVALTNYTNVPLLVANRPDYGSDRRRPTHGFYRDEWQLVGDG